MDINSPVTLKRSESDLSLQVRFFSKGVALKLGLQQ